MPRQTMSLSDYGGSSQVNEQDFNSASSQDSVDYVCLCGTVVESKKRLISARLSKSKILLCDSCKNKENRKKRK